MTETPPPYTARQIDQRLLTHFLRSRCWCSPGNPGALSAAPPSKKPPVLQGGSLTP